MIAEHEVRTLQGLTEADVVLRQNRDGLNELPTGKKRQIWHILFEVVQEPMFMLLLVCGLLYLFLGDIAEASLLLVFVFVIMGITIYQEHKTEGALDALRDLASPRALVIRNGAKVRVAGREVVVDDLIVLREGDRVPADALLVWARNMTIDESLLTGESVPVRKQVQDNPCPLSPGGHDQPYVYSGSIVVQGESVAKVLQTGTRTQIGLIGKSLSGIAPEQTRLQLEIQNLVRWIFLFALILSVAVVVVYGITKGDWLHGVLAGLTLAMAMLPEEFPVVLTLFMAIGAWRVSRHQVLTRRLSALETLGAATVIASDKTGTITENRMRVHALSVNGAVFIVDRGDDLPEEFHSLIEYGILASKLDPFDPMEKALWELGYKNLQRTEHLHEDWDILEEYPISRELLAISHVYKNKDTKGYVVSAKGAPEAIIDLCHLSAQRSASILAEVKDLAKKGLRILGVCRARFQQKALPSEQHAFDFEWVGLIGWVDPVREGVKEAISLCHKAGIQVMMITGDYPETAQVIASDIGIPNDKIITGTELLNLTDTELSERVKTTYVYARIMPEQKLRLVNALKNSGAVVAMTGDGVNDAPALRSAHIGIAMGERGADVAREAADLVLVNDDFPSIVSAIRLGRRIYGNISKAMVYIISVHVPIAGLSLIPVVMGWPLILYPAHIVFLELIIDPACSIVFESEPEPEDIMDIPPRDPKSPMISWGMLGISLLQGFVVLVLILGLYRWAILTGQPEQDARALTFAALIVSNLGLILTNRSRRESMFSNWSKNPTIIYVVVGALSFLSLIVYIPAFQGLFHMQNLHADDIVLALGVGLLSVSWFEVVKRFLK